MHANIYYVMKKLPLFIYYYAMVGSKLKWKFFCLTLFGSGWYFFSGYLTKKILIMTI